MLIKLFKLKLSTRTRRWHSGVLCFNDDKNGLKMMFQDRQLELNELKFASRCCRH